MVLGLIICTINYTHYGTLEICRNLLNYFQENAMKILIGNYVPYYKTKYCICS